ncbi:MAG: hypothetical protein J6V00_05245 [Bacteroidaceae bacterium]|nr:hypothetical protein [Bacteroidaceae bacterium]
MKVKGSDGYEHSVTSQGQGALNSVLGGLGTASFFGVNAGNLLGGIGRNNAGCPNPQDTPVSRYEAAMMQELAAKDGKIALLESNIYTDQKIADVYERLNKKIDRNRDEQNAINLQQAVYNGVNTAAVECIKGQVAQLMGLTKLVVPNASICPGWGNVTVTPAAAPATGA